DPQPARPPRGRRGGGRRYPGTGLGSWQPLAVPRSYGWAAYGCRRRPAQAAAHAQAARARVRRRPGRQPANPRRRRDWQSPRATGHRRPPRLCARSAYRRRAYASNDPIGLRPSISRTRCEDESLVRMEVSRLTSHTNVETARAYLEAALDCVVMIDASGRIVEFNPAAERTFGYSREEAIGRALVELIVPPSLRDGHRRAFARFVETREQRLFGQRLELTGLRADGSEFPVELALSLVQPDPLLVCGALRDVSEAKRVEADLRALADEQAALRRVATLIAREATPPQVFAAVAEEVARTVDVPLTAVVRFEPDGTATQVGVWGTENPFAVGTSWRLDEQSVSGIVARTGRPARVADYGEISGEIAARLAREAGIRTAVGVPVLVEGRPWGVMMALSTEARPLPEGTEARLGEFTALIATAIANTQARDELRRLADEQAALRRVATLVAQGAAAHAVFEAVAAETGQLI